jgi:menaquinone-dependent protoporphyrinogen oxidase
MNTLIIYATIHGTTEKCAFKLTEILCGNIKTINLSSNEQIDLQKYSSIIIGGLIHAGHLNPRIFKFCTDNLQELLNKNIGLFLCFMERCTKGDEYLHKSFPPSLIQKAKATGYFGGELKYEKLSFFEKKIVSRLGVNKSVTKVKIEEIIKFGMLMNRFINSN